MPPKVHKSRGTWILVVAGLAAWFWVKEFSSPRGDEHVSTNVALDRQARRAETEEPLLAPNVGPQPANQRVSAEAPAVDSPRRAGAPGEPDLLFRCALPGELQIGDLEVAALDYSGRDMGVAGRVLKPSKKDLARGAILVVLLDVMMDYHELRSRDRCWSSGEVLTRDHRGTGEVLPLVLRPVSRVALRIEDSLGRAILDPRPSFEFSPRQSDEVFQLPRETGEPLWTSYGRVVELDEELQSMRIERCIRDRLDFRLLHPAFETHEVLLPLAPGQASEQTITMRRLPTAGTLSGRVTTQTGRAPDPKGMTGRVRIVSTESDHRQFNVKLRWEEGVAEWESDPLPFGEYRVWLDDVGKLFATPSEERIFSAPQTRLDWTWHDGSERRNLGLDVRDAQSGAVIDEIWAKRTFAEGRSSDARVWSRHLEWASIPVDCPWLWEVHAAGYEPAALTIADFAEPRTVTPDELEYYVEAPVEVWFARVDLKRKPD